MTWIKQRTNQKKIIIVTMFIFYLLAWLSITYPVQHQINANVNKKYITSYLGLTPNNYIKYKMPINVNKLRELQIGIDITDLRYSNASFQVCIYSEDFLFEKIYLEKQLSELNGQDICVFNMDDRTWIPGTYIIEMRLINADDTLSKDDELVKIGQENLAVDGKQKIEINGLQNSGKLAISISGFIKEKPYTFDLIMIAGFAFLLYALIDSSLKEKENVQEEMEETTSLF